MLLLLFLYVFYGEKLEPGAAKEYVGSWEESAGGRPFAAFQSIRYAQPPVGYLRFQDPVPIEEDDLQMYCESPMCLQLKNDEVVGQEDCLFLNVYTPYINETSLPVVVAIHGGQYSEGSGLYDFIGPQKLMDYDLVVVTINYRLGPLGFASLENDSFPGNYGIKDQLMAVNWVLQNIHLFGGDPARVTLAGHSAGAVCTLFLLNGPLAGKVNRGIAFSGSRYSPWALSTDQMVQKNTLEFSKELNCTDVPKIVDCLRLVDVNELVKAADRILDVLKMGYVPVVDGRYIPSNPWQGDQHKANFSLLLGLTKHEGAFLKQAAELSTTDKLKSVFDKKIDRVTRFGKKKIDFLTLFIRNWGYNYQEFFMNTVTDSSFFFPAVVEAQRHAGPIHASMFNFSTNPGGQNVVQRGVAHGDDMPFLFVIDDGNQGGANHKRVSDKLVQMTVRYVQEMDPELPSHTVDPDLFDITKALLNVSEFLGIDQDIHRRMSYWYSLGLLDQIGNFSDIDDVNNQNPLPLST